VWVGVLVASVKCTSAAANAVLGDCSVLFQTAGAGVTPAAGNLFGVRSNAGANAATGTVGTSGSNFGSLAVVVIAPAGNAVQVQVVTAVAGTGGTWDASAVGLLQ
jgi:hypothetical protein